MQNIPIRSSLGQEIRACFVAPRGKTLLSLDYSQMELRIVAHIAGDAKMQEIFLSGEDIHTATAAEVFGVKPADVTADMRRQAKAINFGILYGLSARGLSESANMSYEQAQAYIDRYFHIFSGAHRYVQRTVEEVRTHGFVSNPLGRKRWLPEINDSRVNIRAAAERAAINMPVQSMQADVIKIAMINLRRAFDLASEDLKLLLQVHDELLFEVHEAGVHELLVRLRQIMEEAVTLSVPIVVEAKAGKNWRDLTVIPKT
jgi:DNA polymerase-1